MKSNSSLGTLITATEAVNRMREEGIPCTTKTLIGNIQNGTWRFGTIISMGTDCAHPRRTVRISRHHFEKWLSDMIGSMP